MTMFVSDSEARFAALELDLDGTPAPTAKPVTPSTLSQAPELSGQGNRQGSYNNVSQGCTSTQELCQIVPEFASTITQESAFTGQGELVEGCQLTVRTYPSGKRQVVGVNGSRYTALQPSFMVGIIDALLAKGIVREIGGGAYEGRIWSSGVFDEKPIIGANGKPDIMRANLLMYDSYDGTTFAGIDANAIRAVCQNTALMAVRNALGIKLRHTESITEAVKEIQESIEVMGQAFFSQLDTWQAMARKPCSEKQLQAYTGYVFSKWADVDEDLTEEHKQSKVYAQIVENYESGQGAEYSRGTVWGAYNAATEYLTHQRGRGTDESRFSDLHFGNGKALQERALNGALRLMEL